MDKEADAAWLDGYLKGISSLSKKGGKRVSLGALCVSLPVNDLAKGFTDYINNDPSIEELELESPSLELGHLEEVTDWPLEVRKLIEECVICDTEEDIALIMHEVVDMIDVIVESISSSPLKAEAHMMKEKGMYLFFDLRNKNYLVLSSMTRT